MTRVRFLALVGVLAGVIFAAGAVLAAEHKADPTAGKIKYNECTVCHNFGFSDIGPDHCGVVGRKAGTLANFAYSEAMSKSGLIWDEKTLNTFLASPYAFMPETYMLFGGVADENARLDLIAYIKQMSDDPKACPKK